MTNRLRQARRAALMAAILPISWSPACALTCTWSRDVNGNWSNLGNWSSA